MFTELTSEYRLIMAMILLKDLVIYHYLDCSSIMELFHDERNQNEAAGVASILIISNGAAYDVSRETEYEFRNL